MVATSPPLLLRTSPHFLAPGTSSFPSPPPSPPAVSLRSRPSRVFASCTSTSTASRESNMLSSSSSSPSSLYELLGVPTSATCQEIKAAYRRLVRVCHPDVVAATESKAGSADEFMKIHAAYSTLSDPVKRASYDRSRQQQLRPSDRVGFTPSYRRAASFNGYGSRTWETDQCW